MASDTHELKTRKRTHYWRVHLSLFNLRDIGEREKKRSLFQLLTSVKVDFYFTIANKLEIININYLLGKLEIIIINV